MGRDNRIINHKALVLEGEEYYQFDVVFRSNVHANPGVQQAMLEYYLSIY